MSPSPQRLVILGSGFGAFSLLTRLPKGLYDVTLISPRNYFLFTPLLPSAVSGTVEFRSILEPIRRRFSKVRLIEAVAESVDLDGRRAHCRGAIRDESFAVDYDLLVVAVGVSTADYGLPGVRERALTLVSVEDGQRIRSELLARFAEAGIPGLSEEEIRRRLTIAVCGGGPTGVEVAAEIQDLLDRELAKAHPGLASKARVVLIEATDRLLTSFDEALGDYARRHFAREGIDVRTSSPVRSVESDHVALADGSRLPCGMVVWAGGNRPLPLVEGLALDKDASGRLRVDSHLKVLGRDDVYALGDCSSLGDPPYPATAQVAQQEGKYLGGALADRARGKKVREFVYRPMGMLAYIGAGRALADLPNAKWSGRAAWFFWRSVYMTRLVSLSNKAKVLFDWFKATLFGRDLSRF